jgi:PAS domain S-box-containing protein
MAVQVDRRAEGVAHERFVDFVYQPTTDAHGRVSGIFVEGNDVTDRVRAETALRESEARFRHMADSAPALIWMTDENGKVVFANMHFGHVFGGKAPEMLGQGWRQVVFPEDLDSFQPSFRSAFERRDAFKAEVRASDKDGQVRWFRCEGVPRLDDAHRFLGYTGCALDITDAKRAEEHKDLLINELNHRVKNTLATVQSIASQTLRNAESPEHARAAVEQRLIALSRAHDVLTRENWESAELGDIVAQALEPYRNPGSDRIRVSGQPARVPPRTALAFAMALQELATNAVKYGALSNETGVIAIGWRLRAGDPPRLLMHWEESGGPPVSRPSRRGFGTRLIERSLAQDLNGDVQIDFAITGVTCTLEAGLG